MQKPYSLLTRFLCLSLLFLPLFSCGTTRSVVQKIRSDNDGLKKRVMIIPLIDRAGFGHDRTARIAADFVGLLRKSPRLLIFQTNKEIIPVIDGEAPGVDVVTPPPELVERMRYLGMNALIIGILNPLETTTKKTGIWPFRDVSSIVEVSMTVNVVDTTSACLYLSRLESEKKAFLIDELPGSDENEVIDEILEEKMPRILKRLSSDVTKTLTQQSWTGKILTVDNGAITINGGEDVGVRPGQVFTVFAEGESIACHKDRLFDLLGKRVGEIKTTSIMKEQSLAVPVAEGAFLPGQVIKARP